MKIFFILCFLFCQFYAVAQNKYSIYYKSGATNVNSEVTAELIDYIHHMDFSKIESISLIAYNDDTGSPKSNELLAQQRAANLQKIIVERGFPIKVETIYQGIVKNNFKKPYNDKHIEQMKNNNRRIDVVPNYKYEFADQNIHSLNLKFAPSYASYPGERIYLDKVTFPNDRSILTEETRKELDKIALLLEKHKDMYVEIQGHICNYPTAYVDAIDLDSGKRELSTNRAKAVYDYFVMKRIEPRRLTYKGYGSHKPLGLNTDLDNRIELLVTKV